MDSSALLHAGLAHLHALRRPYGFDATGGLDGLYSTLFGRDSLWMLMLLLEADRMAPSTSISTLVADAGPDILSSLARLQGTVVEDQIEEQPGKILHEYRPSLDDRVVQLGIPFLEGRSYAGFDQTFLFITAFRMFMERYPESPLIERILPHVERALGWVDGYASSADGLYRCRLPVQPHRRPGHAVVGNPGAPEADGFARTRSTEPSVPPGGSAPRSRRSARKCRH